MELTKEALEAAIGVMTSEQLRSVEEAARTELQRRATAEHDKAKAEFGTRPFTPDELLYASHARCKECNAGLAYPKGPPAHVRASWMCSAVLLTLGTPQALANAANHSEYPFAFWKIESEDQPSQMGATTRPQP